MRKTRQISLKECYAILQVPKDATLDDVKKAYRRRAFELHPDLNPDMPHAGYQFQDLNEAYVALVRVLETEDAQRKATSTAEERRQQEKAYREAGRKAAREEQARAREEEARVREEKAKERAEARARAQESAKAQAAAGEAEDKQRQREEAAERAYEERLRREAASREATEKQRASAAYAKEDVLRDLLHDPFARRVFEDIYSEVNKQGGRKAPSSAHGNASEDTSEQTTAQSSAHTASQGATQTKKHTEQGSSAGASAKASVSPPTAHVELSEDKPSLPFANSFSSKIKGWFRQQIDEQQSIKMPAHTLYVGARIRLQIRRGLSEELSTVEITLPPEFAVGKPIRLRGLGKKVGKWQGDLYLTIESK